jgi:hypothetical protein
VAEALLQREELSREDIDRILRESNIVADGKASDAIFAPGSAKM